jgi:hypothetical protein
MLLFDANKRQSSVEAKCRRCKLSEDRLAPGNPLVVFGSAEATVTHCRECLDAFVQENTRMSFKSNGVIEYFIDNLCVPSTGEEFPSKYTINDVPFDLVTLKFPFAPFYIILERVNYKRPPGHKEGFILRYGIESQEDNKITFGSHPRDNVYLLDSYLQPNHFTVVYSEGCFTVHDHPDSDGTFILKAGKWGMNEYFNKKKVISGDTLIKLSYDNQEYTTSADCVDDRVDLFPQVFSTKAYEAGAEEKTPEWASPLHSPGIDRSTQNEVDNNTSDIDEGINNKNVETLKQVREFRARFKPVTVRKLLC